jgi:hypothetical protein
MPLNNRQGDDTVLRRFVSAQVNALSEYDCEVTVCTSTTEAIDGDVWVIDGIDTSFFERHPAVLYDHDLSVLVGRSAPPKKSATAITAKVTFPPAGISPKADEVRGLVKAGFLTGVSAGIIPLEAEPLDPRNPRGGKRITKSVLIEFSFVSVPADAASGVTARSRGEAKVPKNEWKVGASRNLPIEEGDAAWDGPEAEDQIFEYAGGDDFDPAKARRGFLVYDAANPNERGSYKLPIARVKDGKLVVPKSAIRAAASRLPDTEIPDDVKKDAGEVLDAYKKKAKIGDDEDDDKERGIRAAHRRMFGTPRRQRGLYEVAQLCWLMAMISDQTHTARLEKALEGDDSDVPDLMLDALKAIATALNAMTPEEVGEVLSGHDVDEDELAELSDEERSFVNGAASTLARSFRVAMVQLRSGKAISKSNAEKLEEADGHHTRALRHHKSLGESHKQASEHLEEARGAHRKAEAALKEDGASDDGKERAMRHVRAVGEHLDNLADAHADVGDAHRSAERSVRAARRSVRSVLGQSADGDDANPEKPTDDDEGARSRRARALALKVKAAAARAA